MCCPGGRPCRRSATDQRGGAGSPVKLFPTGCLRLSLNLSSYHLAEARRSAGRSRQRGPLTRPLIALASLGSAGLRCQVAADSRTCVITYAGENVSERFPLCSCLHSHRPLRWDWHVPSATTRRCHRCSTALRPCEDAVRFYSWMHMSPHGTRDSLARRKNLNSMDIPTSPDDQGRCRIDDDDP